MTPLVWFRSDLRVADNPALHEAVRRAAGDVTAVFLVCPDQWRAHDWGAARVDLVLRTLRTLDDALRSRNIPLHVLTVDTFDEAPEALLGLARRRRCDALLFNREYEINERRRDEAVGRAFESAGLETTAWTDQVMLPPGSVTTKTGGFYKVYSAFRRAWGAKLAETGVPRPLTAPRAVDAERPTIDDVPEAVDGFDAPLDARGRWPAGEREAMRRLRAFIRRRIDGYGHDRDFPAIDGTSTLSPYLAVGAVSVRQCLHAALASDPETLSGSATGAGVWIDELAWRDFYRHVLVGFPRVCMHQPFLEWTDGIRWRRSRRDFEAWCAGRTGVPLVDAAMRQLLETSWMHNRLRMVTAMYLAKNLLIDWRWGERHFMNHLVDGDLASNNGGWQWAASTGTDAVPYFRVFNPIRQSQRFDPDGAFIRRFVPELREVEGKAIHDPPPDVRRSHGYPAPIVDLAASKQRAVDAFRTAK